MSCPTPARVGLCECGCGGEAPKADQTRRAKGWVKGEPKRFIAGHYNNRSNAEAAARHRREWAQQTDIPYGFCWCGCGLLTSIAPRNDRTTGRVKGEPKHFIRGHTANRRYAFDPYIVEDRGFETPCWIWQRCMQGAGYGKVGVAGKSEYAHRHYYETHVGPIPDGLQIDHLCKVRACVNPKHLEPVTPAENVRRGAATKLREAEAMEIRSLLAQGGATYGEIAKRFGISAKQVGGIATGLYWSPA